MSNDIQHLQQIKAALLTTTSTPGWSYIKQIANNVLKNALQAALDEEDSAKGETKRLKASALQRGFTDLFNTIETASRFDIPDDADNGLGELETEY